MISSLFDLVLVVANSFLMVSPVNQTLRFMHGYFLICNDSSECKFQVQRACLCVFVWSDCSLSIVSSKCMLLRISNGATVCWIAVGQWFGQSQGATHWIHWFPGKVFSTNQVLSNQEANLPVQPSLGILMVMVVVVMEEVGMVHMHGTKPEISRIQIESLLRACLIVFKAHTTQMVLRKQAWPV